MLVGFSLIFFLFKLKNILKHRKFFSSWVLLVSLVEAAVVKPEMRVCLCVQLRSRSCVLPLPPHRGRFQPQPAHTPSLHTPSLHSARTDSHSQPCTHSPHTSLWLCPCLSLLVAKGASAPPAHTCVSHPPHCTELLKAGSRASGPEGKQSDRRGEGRG